MVNRHAGTGEPVAEPSTEEESIASILASISPSTLELSDGYSKNNHEAE